MYYVTARPGHGERAARLEEGRPANNNHDSNNNDTHDDNNNNTTINHTTISYNSKQLSLLR